MRACALVLLVAGCSAPSKPVTLIEGYCTAGEADRCYYDHAVMDGF